MEYAVLEEQGVQGRLGFVECEEPVEVVQHNEVILFESLVAIDKVDVVKLGVGVPDQQLVLYFPHFL
jgi:hypothetical protein